MAAVLKGRYMLPSVENVGVNLHTRKKTSAVWVSMDLNILSMWTVHGVKKQFG